MRFENQILMNFIANHSYLVFWHKRPIASNSSFVQTRPPGLWGLQKVTVSPFLRLSVVPF